MGDQILSKAINDTGVPQAGAVDNTADTPQDDGTVTIPAGILPPDVKEGDIVQFEYVTETADGCVLRPVETRIKQPGVTNKDVKAAGPDNSGLSNEVGLQPTAAKPTF
jgi:hypothetical protein